MARRTTTMTLVTCACVLVPTAAQAQKGVMLMNRIGPSASTLYVSNADGSNEHALLPTSGMDYHASWSADGRWIVFTSERGGLGQADIYRVRADGTGLERLLETRKLTNLTVLPGIQGGSTKPDAFLRPAWSPDGEWLAFSSDRNTEWKGHGTVPVGSMCRSSASTSSERMALDSVASRRPVFARARRSGLSMESAWCSTRSPSSRRGMRASERESARARHRKSSSLMFIFIMKADGTDKRQLTDSPWEDGMPSFVSNPKEPK